MQWVQKIVPLLSVAMALKQMAAKGDLMYCLKNTGSDDAYAEMEPRVALCLNHCHPPGRDRCPIAQ